MRGEAEVAASDCRVLITLQRSHAPKCVERRPSPYVNSSSGITLQRSHAPKCVESRAGLIERRNRGKASTEPRTEARGRRTPQSASGQLQRSHAPKCVESDPEHQRDAVGFSGFNGATHRSAWRAGHVFEVRGSSRWLQRSHAPKCVESRIISIRLYPL